MLAKRTRASKPKTRTGCLTCKIRRVKCDEIRPFCNRCVSTGRRCDGYAGSQLVKQTQSPNSPGTPLCVNIGGNEQERMLFHYFRGRCLSHLGGSFDQDFWQHSVLQFCYYEPAVRHSIFALASWHRAIGSGNTAIADREGAAKHYIRSIQYLQRSIEDNQPHCKELALIACIMLMACDALRGNFQGSLTHFLSGLSVISSTKAGNAASNSTVTKSAELLQVDIIFSYLKVHAASFSSEYAAQVEQVPVLPERFAGLSEVRSSLYEVLSMGYYWLRCKGEPLKYQDSRPQDVLMQQGALVSLFNQWLMKTRSFESLHGDTNDINHLKMQCLATKIRIQQVLDPSESTYDDYSTEFREIVRLAAKSLQDATSDEERFGFRIHRGVVQPLYFTACKCRHPLVRRKATNLLLRAGTEGVWCGRVMAAVAEHIIKSEEAYLLRGFNEELYRIHGIGVDFNIINTETQTSDLSCSRMAADGGWHWASGQVSW